MPRGLRGGLPEGMRPTALDDGPLGRVRHARDRADDARTRLHAAVAAAREAGHTWAEIGDLLGITRQAAFKRFGTPVDPRSGQPMTPRVLTALRGLTGEVFTALDADDIDRVQALMTPATARALDRKTLQQTWAAVLAETGRLQSVGRVALVEPDGAELTEDDRALGMVVARTTLHCEAGEWHARVAFDQDDLIIGLLVVPTERADLPF